MANRKAGRPRGARNVKPSQKAMAGYIGLLRDSADAGDTQAAAALVNLHASEQMAMSLNPRGERG